MKTNLLKSICSGIILTAFFSCSNEIPIEQKNLASVLDAEIEAQLDKVVIEGGIIKFKDAEALCAAFLNPDMVNSVKTVTKSSEFNSLGDKYAELEKSYELMVINKDNAGEDPSIYDYVENRVRSRILADFLNADGIMIIGDSAVKVLGDYAYSTTTNNYSKLLQMSEKELILSKIISRNRIIEPLLPDDSATLTKSSSGGTYDRTPVFTLTNNSKRREHVVFNPYLLVIQNAQTEIVIEMEGRAQTKQLLGIWGSTFSDELVWGEIYLNNGSWFYNQPPAGGYPIPQGTNYFISGLKSRSTGNCFCGWAQILGNTGGVSNVKASITYKMKKSDYQPSNWASEYTNNYTSISK